jgi:hypothetical protein
MPMRPTTTLQRLCDAINRHNLDAFVAFFASDYQSEQPAHPLRAFSGSEHVRKNWAALFEGVPDLQAEVVRATAQGETLWVEWHWHGTRQDTTPLDVRGVTLFGVRDDRLIWGRLYMEETEAGGADIDGTMERITGQIRDGG